MELLGIKAVALMTGVNEGTLRYWRHANQGPTSFKIGRRIVYRREAIEKWLQEQEASTARGDAAALG